MKRHWKILATSMIGVLAVAGCGDDSGGDDDGGDDSALIDAMVSEGASQQEAECFIEELGGDDAERLYGADEDSLSEEDLDRALEAFTTCAEE